MIVALGPRWILHHSHAEIWICNQDWQMPMQWHIDFAKEDVTIAQDLEGKALPTLALLTFRLTHAQALTHRSQGSLSTRVLNATVMALMVLHHRIVCAGTPSSSTSGDQQSKKSRTGKSLKLPLQPSRPLAMPLPPRAPLGETAAPLASSGHGASTGSVPSSKGAAPSETTAATAMEVQGTGMELAAAVRPEQPQQQPKMSKKQAKKAAQVARAAMASPASAVGDANNPPMPSGSLLPSLALAAMPSNAQDDAALQQPSAAITADTTVGGFDAVPSNIQIPAATSTRAHSKLEPDLQQGSLQGQVEAGEHLADMRHHQPSQLHMEERQQQKQSTPHLSLPQSDEPASTFADARRALRAQQSTANLPAAYPAAQPSAQAMPEITMASPSDQSRSHAQKLLEQGPAKAPAAAASSGRVLTLARPCLSPRQPEHGLHAGPAPVSEVVPTGFALHNQVGNAS